MNIVPTKLFSFYHVRVQDITPEKVYPCCFYLLDEKISQRYIAYPGRGLLSEELFEQIFEYERKGAKFQILKEDLEKLDEKLQERILATNDLRINYEESYLLALEELEESQPDSIIELFQSSFKQESFRKVIDLLEKEVTAFSPCESLEASCLRISSFQIFTSDSWMNREIALNYFLAKSLGCKDEKKLASLILATFIKDLGITQINFVDLKAQQEEYQKHSMYSLFILSKGEFEFSQLTKRLVLESHELLDGTGYPRKKKGDHIHFLSLILNLGHKVFEQLRAGESIGALINSLRTDQYPEYMISKLKVYLKSS
jgi:response regulator RpfG family c-di-GMP phosphodiesterase